MLLAYQKYLYIMRQLEVSDRFPETPAKPGFELQAGFYKLSEFSPEHVIAFTSFSGGHFPLIKSTEQRAGRRGKGKKSTYVALIARRWGEASSLAFFSRLLMVVFPSVLELKTIKNKVWTKKAATDLSWRMRKRFSGAFPESDVFATEKLLDSHRGIFLPVTVSLRFDKTKSHHQLETFSRALRIPVSLFRWWPFPAPDDPEA